MLASVSDVRTGTPMSVRVCAVAGIGDGGCGACDSGASVAPLLWIRNPRLTGPVLLREDAGRRRDRVFEPNRALDDGVFIQGQAQGAAVVGGRW
jgi:hypothetical protein